jgi:uncharacterized protein
MTRRTFLTRACFTGAASLAGAYGYGRWERTALAVERIPLQLKLGVEAPRALRIAQLTDLHIDPLFDEAWIAEYVAATNALKPDITVLTGDLITSSYRALPTLAKHLEKLHAPGGVFASPGNHDQWNMPIAEFRRVLQNHGLRVLANEPALVEIHAGKVPLGGIESLWGGRPHLENTLRACRPEAPAILLAHEPDLGMRIAPQRRTALPIALQLSGHTHGGQVCIPGPIILRKPSYGKELVRGHYADRLPWQVYVNRGIGTLGPHIRIAAPPEIALLEITNTSRT